MLLSSELTEGGLDEIVLAHGYPRRRDEEIAAEPPLEASFDVRLTVRRHPEAHWIGVRLAHLSHKRVGVGVGNLSRAEAAAEVDDLVARGEDAHSRPPHHAHLGTTERGEDPDLRRAEETAGLEHAVPCPHVLAARAHVVAHGHWPRNPQELSLHRHVFLGDHAVVALRQRAAREDAERLARDEGARGHLSRGHAAGHGEARGSRRGGRPRVRAAQRVAIHGGIRPWRKVEGRHRRFREHAMKGVTERYLLVAQHADAGENALERFFDGNHAGIVTSPARDRRRSGWYLARKR